MHSVYIHTSSTTSRMERMIIEHRVNKKAASSPPVRWSRFVKGPVAVSRVMQPPYTLHTASVAYSDSVYIRTSTVVYRVPGVCLIPMPRMILRRNRCQLQRAVLTMDAIVTFIDKNAVKQFRYTFTAIRSCGTPRNTE